MKRISIDNGTTFVTPEKALEEVGLDTLATYMDEEVREKVHNRLSPCSPLDFLEAYLEAADTDLII